MTLNLSIILSISLPLIILIGCTQVQEKTSSGNQPQNPITAAQKAVEQRSLEQFTILEGTPYKLGAVVEGNNDRGLLSGISSSSYKGNGNGKQVNYIFLNTQTKESVKLLPKSDLLFNRLEKVGKRNSKGEFSQVDAIWYEVIKQEGNNQSADRQKKTIATSTVAGANYTELIPQVDRVLNTFQTSPTKILMVYELNKKYFIAELDLGSRKLIDTKELPNLE